LRGVFGTLSEEYSQAMFGKLVAALRPTPFEQLDEATLNPTIALVASMEPKTELEALRRRAKRAPNSAVASEPAGRWPDGSDSKKTELRGKHRMSTKDVPTSTASAEHTRRYRQRHRRGMQRITVPLSDSDLDVLVRKGYLAPEERGRHRAMKQALEAFLSDSAHACGLSRRAPKNINGR